MAEELLLDGFIDELEGIDSEDEDIDLANRKSITFEGKDWPIDGLHRQYEKGRLLI